MFGGGNALGSVENSDYVVLVLGHARGEVVTRYAVPG